MKFFKFTSLAFATAVIAGCASNVPLCGPGSNHPSCGAKTAPMAPAGESPAEQKARLDAFEQKLQAEIKVAEQSLASAVAAGKNLPPAQRAKNPMVKTTSAPLADSKTGRVFEFKVLDTASIDMPLAGKGKRGYVEAMDEIKELANQLADSRGSSAIIVDQAAEDIKARRVNTKSGVTQTQAGNAVAVEKTSSGKVPRGIERYTIKLGEVTVKP